MSAAPVVPYTVCPAKTYRRLDGVVVAGRSTIEHCQIVGEMARALVTSYPASMRMALFPEGVELVAGAHDIGKVSPTFVEKIKRACDITPDQFHDTAYGDPGLEKTWGGHAGISQVTAMALGAGPSIPKILGRHHGYAPTVDGLDATAPIFGGAEWSREREKLFDALRDRLGISEWPIIDSIPAALVAAGLTTVADWIGSGEYFEDPAIPWRDAIGKALANAGFGKPVYRSGLSFADIFMFEPKGAQARLYENVSGPGVYVMEAPMGTGKTEAALYSAYKALASGFATGVYFALPTRLTSDKIHSRFERFLGAILSDATSQRALLLHGAAHMQETGMGEEGAPGGSWFNHAKRGLLAPFAVGTVDQALMAAMNVKHGFVRTFGLAGKVVIIDEVHTYDAYTGTILDELVSLLRRLYCTVIILSATLNRERREELVGAPVCADGYPLVTAAPTDEPMVECAEPATETYYVTVTLLSDERLAVNEALDRSAAGEQVLWIENTVEEAQNRYLDLAAMASGVGVACGLLHSRFTVSGRDRIEEEWVSRFGKEGSEERGAQGRILVGTQVLEQSLDIDADFLVTRFAPTDMTLQRIGRLWRHPETLRPTSARREVWIIAPSLDSAVESPDKAFGKSAFVYAPYVLCRSLEVWSEVTTLTLPGAIRPLIEATYRQREETGQMARWLRELDEGTAHRKGRKALRNLALQTLADGKTLPERKAETRYSDTETFDLLLLRSMGYDAERKETAATLLDGSRVAIPSGRERLTRQEWRRLGARLAREVVSAPAGSAPKPLAIDTLKRYGLHHIFYLGDPGRDEALLRVALVGEDGALRGVEGAPLHETKRLMYSDDLGYRSVARKGK